jgi:ADP-dependent NAD(P)H-hydrate dehydratase / NAD(P)H-hydrate epimerase
MTGAAHLAVAGTQRAGAGYVRLSSPGVADDPLRPTEAVGVAVPATGWATTVLDDLARFAALIVGPGLGRGSDSDVRRLVAGAPCPVVVDGDGLTALGPDGDVLSNRREPTVLTPHDGEFARLAGADPGPDRFAAVRALATSTRSVVVLKGSPTLVGNADGQVLVVTTGDARLATAGTGDVLAGIIGALLAQGVEPFSAAAAGAHLHGSAGAVGSRHGLVAGDLPNHLPLVFDQLSHPED